MSLQTAGCARPVDVRPAWTPTPTAIEARHLGLLAGATLTGEAAHQHLAVRVGLWLDERGWVRQARWRGEADDPLRAYAEAACSLLEAGVDPVGLDGDSLRSAVEPASSGHGDRADLVASAVAVAVLARGAQGA